MTQTNTPEDSRKALAEAEEAVRRDPGSGEAWGRLGCAYNYFEAYELA